jgi:hypothetical protein
MKLEFSRQIFKKSPNTKFHDNPSSGRRGILCGRRDGQTDRDDEVNSRFSQFYELAYKLKCAYSDIDRCPCLILLWIYEILWKIYLHIYCLRYKP